MSDLETVALISIFLVLSAIIVWLIGGDADRAIADRGARAKAQTAPEPVASRTVAARSEHVSPANAAPAQARAEPLRAAAPAPTPVTPSAPPAVRPEPPKSAVNPVEASMVKIDLPPPTPIPNANVAPAQAPSAPLVAPPAPAPARASAPAAAAPAPAAQPVVQSTAPAAPAASTAPATVRPDVKATIQPGSSTAPGAPVAAKPSGHVNLSAEEQAIVSRYLRPDVKSTLYRDPPPGAIPPPAPPKPSPEAVQPPAPRAAPPAPPAGPLVISKPSVEGTLPSGYQAPAPAAVSKPVGETTGFAPLGVRPDARATQASYVAEAAPAAPSAPSMAATPSAIADVSPRAARAAAIAPSDAVDRTQAAAAQTPPAQGTSSEIIAASAASATDSNLLSTAKRGTRVVGAEANDVGVIELERPAVPRPQTPSIWSNTVPRRALSDSELREAELTTAPQGIRAERVPVRAETILVRPDASRTIDPSAPKYTSIPKPPPVANARIEARPLPDVGSLANVRFTLPPGALGNE